VARLLSTAAPAATSAARGAAAPGLGKKAILGPRISNGGASGAANGGNRSVSSGPATFRVSSSGTNYQPGRLAAQASAVLAGHSPKPLPSAGIGRVAPVLAFPDLAACVSHVAGRRHPLLVDVARYRGHPAAIIVLPATNSAKSRVLVIAEGCTATTAHILATAPFPVSH